MSSLPATASPATMVPYGEVHSENESVVYRNLHCFRDNGGKLISSLCSQPEAHTSIDLLAGAAIKYPDCDCVGSRRQISANIYGDYEYISYKSFFRQCTLFGRGLLELGLHRGDKIGIFSSNSVWWQTVHFGSASVGMAIVPIYDSLGEPAVEYIVEHSEIRVIVCSEEKLEQALSILKVKNSVQIIIVAAENIQKSDSNASLFTCAQILSKGEHSSFVNDYSKPYEIGMILYTSGSTGIPKGCVLTQANLVAGAAGLGNVNMSCSTTDTFLSFLPLAHIYAFTVELLMYAQGARVAFAKSKFAQLLDDIKSAKPTIIVSVPRFLNRLHSKFCEEIDKSFFKKIILTAISLKVDAIKKKLPQSLVVDSIVFSRFREALGGSVKLIVNGGAPITAKTFEFLSATITPNIIQGYGLTETSAGLAVQEVPASNPLTVGPCSIACEIKLKKVEGYDPNDKNPSGELLVRGPIVFSGYYKQAELTADVMANGWFATGDVVRITEDGQLQIIDRVKQLVKLSQGEYISLTALTDIYSRADVVSFVYIFADSFHDRPLAVVVPKEKKIQEWKSRGIVDITNDISVHNEIIASLDQTFTESKLRGFERIRRVLVDTYVPTVANGLLTPSLKPQYVNLKKRYETQLQAIYAQLEARA